MVRFSPTLFSKGPTIPTCPVPLCIGGVIKRVAWTGYKPTSIEHKGTNLTEPRIPFCFRPTSPISFRHPADLLWHSLLGQTLWQDRSREWVSWPPVEDGHGCPSLGVHGRTERDAGECNCCSALQHHQWSAEMYFEEMEAKGYMLDMYDERKNGNTSKSWLLNLIESTLCASLYTKLDCEAHCMVVWMTLEAEIRSESYTVTLRISNFNSRDENSRIFQEKTWWKASLMPFPPYRQARA